MFSQIKNLRDNLFQIIFLLCLLILIVLLIWNYFSGNKGTFVNYSSTIWDLLGKPTKKLPKKPFESKGEIECRRAIEKLTGHKFPKTRPSFLMNVVSGHNLELDCYNDELQMAVEYNGEQHYKFIPYFHSSKDAFQNLKYRDEMKQRLCKENGINLITVPYTVKIQNIESYLKQKLG